MSCQTYNADDVSAILGTSKAYAYKLIQRLNEELAAHGYITVPGKVTKSYFEARVCALDGGAAHVG